MKDIEIKLWGSVVGKAHLDDNNKCHFQYTEDFIKKGIEISPIVMPLSSFPYSFNLSDTFKGLPGLLSDSLPDKFGNAVINAWLKSEGRNPQSFSALEQLCYIGKRGMGALEYYPIIKDVNNKSEIIEIEHLVDLCNKILSNRENILIDEKQDYINQLINIGTSAGGARAKAIVAYNNRTGRFKSGQIDAGNGYEYYLIKFGNVKNNKDKEEADSDYHTRIEYAYYLLAQLAGVKMSESSLIHNNGYHFMTKRFDRFIDENGKMQKLHMQSLGGLAHMDFNNPGANSYDEVAEIMQRLHLTRAEREQFYRRMIFNVIFKNQDDHVKNIAFLMDKDGKWSLAPAYDVTFAYNLNGIWTSSHQMRINGKRTNIKLNDIYECGQRMELPLIRIQNVVREVEAVKDNWIECAKKAFIPEKKAREIENKFEKLD